jgi:glycosyltransferase involved in cell wall biosynthesis
VREPSYSVLISTRNEGEFLRRTLDSLLRHAPAASFEIVVIDDASTDGSTRFLENGGHVGTPVRLERNDVCRGLIYSRAQAAELATGSHLCVLDAHCCVTEHWLERLAERLGAVAGQGLVVPGIRPLEPETWTIATTQPGMTACTITTPFLDFGWCDPTLVDGLPCTGTMPGGAWMCTREWYHEVGGLDRGMILWGAENIDFALRTWVLGGWCLVAADIEIGHLFKSDLDQKKPIAATTLPAIDDSSRGRVAGSSDSGVALAFNKIRAAHNIFAKGTLDKVIKNIRYVPGFKEALDLVRKDADTLVRMKHHVESRRKRSDRWLIETFALPVMESPFFHCRRARAQRDDPPRRRPSVSVVVSSSGDSDHLRDLISSVVDRTAYGLYDLMAFSPASSGPGLREEARQLTSRLRLVETSGHLGGGVVHNCAAQLSTAKYIAFLGDDARVLDEHWLEEFLLLFERRSRLLMASPRLVTAEASGAEAMDVFDVIWDWQNPSFSRERRGTPASPRPYQALSCPGTCFMVHRERFLDLAGFDRTVRGGAPPLMDLAVRGWLSGYEVFCHPGITMGRTPATGETDPVALSWHDYVRALIAETYFTNPTRLRSFRARNPAAGALSSSNGICLQRRREALQERRRFDDDWLFYKFGIEDLSIDVELEPAIRQDGDGTEGHV